MSISHSTPRFKRISATCFPRPQSQFSNREQRSLGSLNQTPCSGAASAFSAIFCQARLPTWSAPIRRTSRRFKAVCLVPWVQRDLRTATPWSAVRPSRREYQTAQWMQPSPPTRVTAPDSSRGNFRVHHPWRTLEPACRLCPSQRCRTANSMRHTSCSGVSESNISSERRLACKHNTSALVR